MDVSLLFLLLLPNECRARSDDHCSSAASSSSSFSQVSITCSLIDRAAKGLDNV